MADNSRKRKKRYFSDRAAKRARAVLEAGMKGFLITCNHRENDCRREAYSILNEYADELYGPEKLGGDDDENLSTDDIEDALAREISDINSKGTERRFHAVESGAKNVVFIRSSLADDVCLSSFVHHILRDLHRTKAKKARHCQRLLPVNATCKANISDIKQLAEAIFRPFFHSDKSKGLKFCVVYKARNNQSLNRDDVIRALAEVVLQGGGSHSVDLSHPDLTVVVEIIKNICCLTVVKEYMTLRKYNLHLVSDNLGSDHQTGTLEINGHKSEPKLSSDRSMNNSVGQTDTDNVEPVEGSSKDSSDPKLQQDRDLESNTEAQGLPCRDTNEGTGCKQSVA